MPQRLKQRLADEVSARGASLNDVAVGILASRFAVDYTPTGRKGTAPRSSGDVLLRMPLELKDKLARRASERRTNTNDLIVDALSAGLGLEREEPMASENGSSNGKARTQDKVRVAIIGVGNCANSLLQGLQYYKDAAPDQFVPGLMHVDLGGYHISEIEVVAAFDVVKGKVGVDLAEAMWAHPNDTIKFAEVPKTGVTVSRGMTHDGIGKYLSEVVEKAPGETDDVVGILRERNVDVVVNYLPVGSEEAAKWYAEQILAAGCAMVNCMPVFIAREAYWQRRFEEKGLPIIGDDIKSQVGATITHRVLTSLFRERGVHLDRTMQLNVGGNSDFLNMLERERLESKKISKTNAVTSMLDYDLGAKNVHVGPSDYVPWLTDRKWAFIRLEGSAFGDVPLNVELKLEVWDSPNSAGIVIDAVRLAKLALNNGVAGALEGPSSYLMKSPPKQIVDDEAYELSEAFIKQYARKAPKAAKAGAAA
ncbi:MAG TPA: inositol-3-phosphate synthase [Gaiellaceae bacterium]